MRSWHRLGSREEIALRAPYAVRLDGDGRKAQRGARPGEVAP